ncbi:nucleotide pyrophosphohydrolase [Mycobacterium phage Bachome]|nr:nucleotide pyrophosphohydrolase [Mycobacterium phage Jabith]AXH50744.1 MazG-like nucleotide pyrophosphohydrolase [Mycobacterium phage Snape]QBI97893.1 MazG-like nucleotide pyrophosphohydrolase [Mycobacterium phage Orange]QBI99091.1 MazG-like nucleotide pyrophosphohydrolase [Mycobacterium phage Salz]QGJ91359.1 nucleotide pyrophosphohydrolase [Mycobacterium phage Bachome]QPX61990.1 MazG-like nucleotide pyrophosphohydrolase [Mycobacterium phage Flaverint]UAW09322.1 MazG-like nucleotide pyroph
MHLLEYQLRSADTAIYPGAGDVDSITGLSYTAMGLAGEAGEVANKVKKILRDQDGIITIENRVQLHKELGDVLWYLSQLATQIGSSLPAVAEDNIQKLSSRKDRGVLQGSGDER